MAKPVKYKITNITRKKEPKNKREAVGFIVSVFVTNGTMKTEKPLLPGQHTITEVIEEHHLKYQKGELISITPIKDVSVLLAEHTSPAASESTSKKTTKKTKKSASKETTSSEVPESLKKKTKRMATAVTMDAGTRKAKEELESENEGAVNPDGKDNFTAVAKNDGKGKVDESKFTVTAPSKSNK